MDKIKTFFLSLLSRKFLVAVAAAVLAHEAAIVDQIVTIQELQLIIAPILAFIGVEGVADIKKR